MIVACTAAEMVAGIFGAGSVGLGVDGGEDERPVGDEGCALAQAIKPVATVAAANIMRDVLISTANMHFPSEHH